MRIYLALVAAFIAIVYRCSFDTTPHPEENVLHYYEVQMDSLLLQLHSFEIAAANKTVRSSALKMKFLQSRDAYKKLEFLIGEIDGYHNRMLNGPDLVRIEEDNPGDTLRPHGLQVMEGLLYGDNPNRTALIDEIKQMQQTVAALRQNEDRKYQLTNAAIWEGLRYGVYRIITLGITGFDAPASLNSIPETETALRSMQQVMHYYRVDLSQRDPALFTEGDELFRKSISYISKQRSFNDLDRLTFIRNYLNPLSAWITKSTGLLGYFKPNERKPLNKDAENLFAENIFDISFFSPNGRYQMTKERIALGRQLFFDPRLSGNNNRSCASCHDPAKAFADGIAKPLSLDGTHSLPRNTPTLWNVVFQTRQFFDLRTDKLENQLSAVVHNTEEMNGSLNEYILKLQKDTSYPSQFTAAYPFDQTAITTYNVANAISCFVRSLISFNAPFDQYMRGETDTYTNAAKNGFNLFMGKAKCGTCHYAPMFNGLVPPDYNETESEILGVPAARGKAVLDSDEGKFRFTHIAIHKYAFKTPTLRNIALTAPYMHNGVYRTLDEVMDFYNKGGGSGLGIDIPGQTLPSEKLNLSPSEMKDIVAFLNSLSDTTKY